MWPSPHRGHKTDTNLMLYVLYITCEFQLHVLPTSPHPAIIQTSSVVCMCVCVCSQRNVWCAARSNFITPWATHVLAALGFTWQQHLSKRTHRVIFFFFFILIPAPFPIPTVLEFELRRCILGLCPWTRADISQFRPANCIIMHFKNIPHPPPGGKGDKLCVRICSTLHTHRGTRAPTWLCSAKAAQRPQTRQTLRRTHTHTRSLASVL